MQQITDSLAVATNLFREGNNMILDFLDYRWSNAENMSEEESNLVLKLIGAEITPRQPWNHFSQSQWIIDLFCRPGSHIVMILRIPDKPTLCVYVPARSELRSSPSKTQTNYYGRSAYVTKMNGQEIQPVDLVMHSAGSGYNVWISRRGSSQNFAKSFSNLLPVWVSPNGRAQCDSNEIRNDCTLEWFSIN